MLNSKPSLNFVFICNGRITAFIVLYIYYIVLYIYYIILYIAHIVLYIAYIVLLALGNLDEDGHELVQLGQGDDLDGGECSDHMSVGYLVSAKNIVVFIYFKGRSLKIVGLAYRLQKS